MIEFLILEAYPFSIALMVMVLLGVVELIGFGASLVELDFVDLDSDGHPDNPLLDWLGVGSLPLLVILVVLLATFGSLGLAAMSTIGLPLWFAVIVSAVGTVPVAGVISAGLAKVWPQDETTAISQRHFLGKRVEVISPAAPGKTGEAKFRDEYGQMHYINVRPHGDTELQVGDVILLVTQEGSLFRGIDPTGGFRTE